MTKYLYTFMFACFLTSCQAHTVALQAETGLRAAEKVWHTRYLAQADLCAAIADPRSAEMEACFGTYFDTNAKVETAVRSAVSILRAYWAARAAGDNPDAMKAARDIAAILDSLPDEAREVFDRIK